MNLYVDIGNSRLKWAQGDPSGWSQQVAPLAGHDPGDLYTHLWSGLPVPSRLVVASVAKTEWSETLRHWARDRWGREADFVASSEIACGVRNRYQNPAQLGVDRWLALIGARRLSAAATIVIDGGTAVTVDALNADGEFVGGVILPGLNLQRTSLWRGTAGIADTVGEAGDCLARDTASAVAAGTLQGLAGAIDHIVARQRQVLGAGTAVLITGGDAPVLMPQLGIKARHVPDLVLRGLHALGETTC